MLKSPFPSRSYLVLHPLRNRPVLKSENYINAYFLGRCYAFLHLSVKVKKSILWNWQSENNIEIGLYLFGEKLDTVFESIQEPNGDLTYYAVANETSMQLLFADEIRTHSPCNVKLCLEVDFGEHPLFVAVRNSFVAHPPRIGMTSEAGFGDIIMNVAYCSILIYLLGVSFEDIELILLRPNHGNSADRTVQRRSISNLFRNVSEDNGELQWLGPYMPSVTLGQGNRAEKMQALLSLIKSYAASIPHTATSRLQVEKKYLILGGAFSYDLLCGMLASIFPNARANRNNKTIFKKACSRSFGKFIVRSPSHIVQSQEYAQDCVICHSRLGDTARIRIGNSDVIPYFLDAYGDSHDQWIANLPDFRANSFNLEKLKERLVALYPGLTVVLVSDGYALALELLQKPTSIKWIANKLGIDEKSAFQIICESIMDCEHEFNEIASSLFGSHTIIGSSAEHNDMSINAIANARAVASTSGHFCFSIMNFISKKRQTLYAKTEGNRFYLKRKNLRLLPIGSLFDQD